MRHLIVFIALSLCALPSLGAKPAPWQARKAPGIERFDHVALLEAGVLCGTRVGHAPVCAADKKWRHYAAPYEALDDVVKLGALNDGHCALYGSGDLHCQRRAPHSPPAVEAPERWPLVARGVVDVVLTTTPEGTSLVFALTADGAVISVRPGLAGEPAERTRQVALGARAIATNLHGVCAIIGQGEVHCTDPSQGTGALSPGPERDARALFPGRIIVHEDGRITGDARLPAEGPRVLDWAPQAACSLTADGQVSCRGLGPRDHIALPSPGERFHPDGSALCAVMRDETTACFGPFLDTILRLARRPDGAP